MRATSYQLAVQLSKSKGGAFPLPPSPSGEAVRAALAPAAQGSAAALLEQSYGTLVSPRRGEARELLAGGAKEVQIMQKILENPYKAR